MKFSPPFNEMSPRVSIVMPCHNSERHLPASVGSVLAQSFPDWELIAVDDGSQDGTRAWLEAQDDPRIRVIPQNNQGVSAARNNGLRHCGGEYVAFLDSDDTWSPNFLRTMADALASEPDAVLAYCGWQNTGLPGRRAHPFVPKDHEGPDKALELLQGCRWPIHACLTRRKAIATAGGFDPELRIGEDYLLWMEVAAQGRIRLVPEVLAYYHHHDGVQATRDKRRGALDTLLAKQKFLGRHPEVVQRLGKERVEALTWGKFIEQANTLYWQGDRQGARMLLHKAVAAGKGGVKEKLRLLRCLLGSGRRPRDKH